MTSAFENYLKGGVSFPQPEPPPETWTQKNWTLSFADRARRRVFEYVTPRLEKTDDHVTFEETDVYITSFSFILKGWKAMVSTSLPDGMYYEVTFNKDTGETYLDAYKKFDNVCYPD
jgi:hypothetical protein